MGYIRSVRRLSGCGGRRLRVEHFRRRKRLIDGLFHLVKFKNAGGFDPFLIAAGVNFFGADQRVRGKARKRYQLVLFVRTLYFIIDVDPISHIVSPLKKINVTRHDKSIANYRAI